MIKFLNAIIELGLIIVFLFLLFYIPTCSIAYVTYPFQKDRIKETIKEEYEHFKEIERRKKEASIKKEGSNRSMENFNQIE